MVERFLEHYRAGDWRVSRRWRISIGRAAAATTWTTSACRSSSSTPKTTLWCPIRCTSGPPALSVNSSFLVLERQVQYPLPRVAFLGLIGSQSRQIGVHFDDARRPLGLLRGRIHPAESDHLVGSGCRRHRRHHSQPVVEELSIVHIYSDKSQTHRRSVSGRRSLL